MSETLNLTKPLFTKRGGKVTLIEDMGPRHGYWRLRCEEDFHGDKCEAVWSHTGFFADNPCHRDLTNTPPASVATEAKHEPLPAFLSGCEVCLMPGSTLIFDTYAITVKGVKDGAACLDVVRRKKGTN